MISTRVRRGAVLAVLLGCPAIAAAETSTQLTVNASSGVTDNALSVSKAATESPQTDVFVQLDPTLRFDIQTARLVQLISLGASLSRYLSESQANSFSARSELALTYELSPLTKISAGLVASYLDVAAIIPDAMAAAVPTGGARYVAATARGSLFETFNARWRGLGEVTFGTNLPIGDAPTTSQSLTGTAAVTAQVLAARDAGEATLTVGLNDFEPPDIVGAPSVSRQDANVALVLRWLHELSPFWALTLGGGATLHVPDQGTATVDPVAQARIDHVRNATTIYFELANTVHANTLLGETFAVAQATAGVNGHIGPFALSVSASASHGTSLGDIAASAAARVDSARFAASLSWAARENIEIVLHQDFVFQVTERSMAAGDEQLIRNSVMLGVMTYFPTHRPSRAELPLMDRLEDHR